MTPRDFNSREDLANRICDALNDYASKVESSGFFVDADEDYDYVHIFRSDYCSVLISDYLAILAKFIDTEGGANPHILSYHMGEYCCPYISIY